MSSSKNPFSSFGATRAMVSSLGSVGSNDSRRPQNGFSYVAGVGDEPLRFRTISQQLDRAVERHGARDAMFFAARNQRLSWYDLQRQSDDLAAALLALGINRGDRVGIWAPNRLEWVLTQFGTARIGAIMVNINPAYRLSELEYALNKVQCKVLITARSLKGSDYVDMLRKLFLAGKLPHLQQVVILDDPAGGDDRMPDGPLGAIAMKFAGLIALAGPAQKKRLVGLGAALDPDDPINIQFTSGTTGAPKGATLTHFNIVNNARYIARAMALSDRDVLAIPVPLYHCFGMVLGVLACVSSGSAMVFPGESFEADQTLAAVEKYQCTALHGVPTMFIAMLSSPNFAKFDLSTLRTGIMAGAPCPIETMRRVVSEMHLGEITIAYGMTETSPVSFQSSTDDSLEHRVSTVGRIQPHVEVKIINGEGRIVPIGQSGELCTRGYSVMQGYWDDAPRTHEAIDAAGWMHTGDLATIDADGFCNIVGRVKDMLIRGGENVYPREVEEFLYTHPKVAAAQVFGVPDPKYGEDICAWLVLKPGEISSLEEIRAFCQGQIAHFKVPRYVKVVAEFPVTATGKPQKFIMREQMIQELGLSAQKTA